MYLKKVQVQILSSGALGYSIIGSTPDFIQEVQVRVLLPQLLRAQVFASRLQLVTFLQPRYKLPGYFL